jgi:hypothetical protein
MGVLLMLMTIGGLLTAVILLIVAFITKKRWLRNFVVGGVAVWVVFYSAMLLGFSLTSTEKVLAAGEPKEYCGFYLDCHMHTEVTKVRTERTIGDRAAKGMFYVVNVKVFSDAKNDNVALHLIEPKARVILANGDKVERDEAAEAKLPTATVRLDRDIHNNETIEKEIVFDLPTVTDNPKLLITEGYGIDKTIEHLLVGDEDSIFHAQTFFELREQKETAGVK